MADINERLAGRNGLDAADFAPREDTTRRDIEALADTVLALCDIIEGGASDGVE